MKKLLLSAMLVFSSYAIQAESFGVNFFNPYIEITAPKEITAKVNTGPGVYFNSYYKQSWIMNFNGSSFIDVTFTNNLQEGTPASLDLIHLSSMVGPINYSPITITLNDKAVLNGYSPVSNNYQSDSFDITQFVKTGENRLRISFDNDAISNYWIQKLEVNFQ